MKQVLLLFLTFMAFPWVYGQQDKQMTHYMFDKMSFNPAATGMKGICGTFIYRNQWDKVQDAPNTSLLNFQANLPNRNLGLGVSYTNDVIGFQKNNILTLNAAYHLRTNAGILSGGLGVGIINIGFDPTWIPPEVIPDPLLPTATSQSGFDVNVGLYWHGTTLPYYVGISSTHIAPATLQNVNFSVARHYYIIAGYNYTFTRGRQIDIKPSVLVKADGATAIFDINVMSNYWINDYSYLWGGLTYRMADGVAFNLGYAFSPAQTTRVNMLKFGYSFDIMTNPMRPYGRGSHELMVNFCFNPPPKGRGRFGNPFILN